MGYFHATLYLEVGRLWNETGSDIKKLDKDLQIEVFGEFTFPYPWQIKVPCTYDNFFGCFKANVTIKEGQNFKFVINSGKHFEVSSRYRRVFDTNGNENNMYEPKSIIWTTERKRQPQQALDQTQMLQTLTEKLRLHFDQDLSLTETNSESWRDEHSRSFIGLNDLSSVLQNHSILQQPAQIGKNLTQECLLGLR